MFHKILKISLVFLFLLPIINASYYYNSTFTNISIDKGGWCPKLEISFTVYNKTEYTTKKTEIENDLCKGNETPVNDRCLEFEKIAASVKIYDGPFNNVDKLLLDTTLIDSVFKYKFTKKGGYLVEVYPSGNFNDWHEKLEILSCKYVTNETGIIKAPTEKIIPLKNESFYYDKTKTTLEIKNTRLNTSDEFIVKSYLSTRNIGLTKLNNTLKIIQILGKTNFTKLVIKTEVENINTTKNFKIYKYNSVGTNWIDLGNGTLIGTNVVISSAELGIYAIAQDPPKNEEIKVEAIEEVAKINSTLITQRTSTSVNSEVKIPSSKSSNLNIIIFSLVVLLIIIIIGAIIYNKKHKASKEDKENLEYVVSYADIVTKTQEYVGTYKNSFSQDQIYRALKEAKVPMDIIDKVFALEY